VLERERVIANADNIAAWSAVSQAEIEAFGDDGDFARQHLLTPQLLDLLGDVAGHEILDAGAGTGYLARKLARLGATVTALEPTEPMFQYMLTREAREPLHITLIQQDLSEMTQFTEHFDIVVANMVLLDIPDFRTAIRNCLQALRRGGAFIFSLEHPSFAGADKSRQPYQVSGYFTERAVPRTFGHNFHRTLETYVDVLADNGALVERVKEPQLAAELTAQYPAHAWGHDIPAFIVVKALKLGASTQGNEGGAHS